MFPNRRGVSLAIDLSLTMTVIRDIPDHSSVSNQTCHVTSLLIGMVSSVLTPLQAHLTQLRRHLDSTRREQDIFTSFGKNEDKTNLSKPHKTSKVLDELQFGGTTLSREK